METPPKGYLQRLREICDKHGILLIFDEVICAFGRTGDSFAATRFGVTPDLITTAKGLTSGTVPMGAVLARKAIYDTFMTGPDNAIEFFHGYTYSGHPLAAAAGCATLDVYAEEGLFERARSMEKFAEDALHSLKGEPHVIDPAACSQCGSCLSVCPPTYAAVYRSSGERIRYEDRKLQDLFGDEWQAWGRETPAMFPTRLRWRANPDAEWNPRQSLIRNGELIYTLFELGAAVLLWYRAAA